MSLFLGICLVYFVEALAHHFVCHELHSPVGDPGKLMNTNKEHDTEIGRMGLNFLCDGIAERDGHNHGIHVHHEGPPSPCDNPAAYFLTNYVILTFSFVIIINIPISTQYAN